jgi:hypothetical protein
VYAALVCHLDLELTVLCVASFTPRLPWLDLWFGQGFCQACYAASSSMRVVTPVATIVRVASTLA